MVKSHVRVAPEFIKLRDVLKQNLEPEFGRQISDRELTRDMAVFLDRENLIPIMVRRARNNQRRRGGGGMFI